MRGREGVGGWGVVSHRVLGDRRSGLPVFPMSWDSGGQKGSSPSSTLWMTLSVSPPTRFLPRRPLDRVELPLKYDEGRGLEVRTQYGRLKGLGEG